MAGKSIPPFSQEAATFISSSPSASKLVETLELRKNWGTELGKIWKDMENMGIEDGVKKSRHGYHGFIQCEHVIYMNYIIYIYGSCPLKLKPTHGTWVLTHQK
jgi:hypothetical protein